MRNATIIAAAAALAVVAPATASAQTAADNAAVDTSYGEPQREEDNDFPWGLLGLLGLLGLMPKKRHDPIVVDNRTNTGDRR
jgi:hypothetical protein